jgi:hypothetical protein
MHTFCTFYLKFPYYAQNTDKWYIYQFIYLSNSYEFRYLHFQMFVKKLCDILKIGI